MNGTLLDLAAAYDREASNALRWQTRDDRHRTADLLRRMVDNRAATDPTRLKLTMTMPIDIPDRWCSQHGYRAIVGIGGCTLQRGSEPTIVASIGDTLLWDGERITVETR